MKNMIRHDDMIEERIYNLRYALIKLQTCISKYETE